MAQTIETDIPSHVPPELVRRWSLASAPGVESDPFAANRPLVDGPAIFYTPLMKSPTDPGSWVVTRTDLIREVYQDTETFTSKSTSGMASLCGDSWDLIPLEIDPPDHTKYRALMNPLFSPAKINAMEAGIRGQAIDRIEAVLPQGGCDFQEAFGRPFPVTIFLQLMGLPLELTPQFLDWEDKILHAADFAGRAEGALAIKAYLLEMIEERRKHPVNDLISFAVTAKVEDRTLSTDEILGICFLLFVGGLDTVASTLGFAFTHLAQNQENQAQLRERPDLIPNAVEEILRAHAVVNSPRHAACDVTFHGAPMKKGDRLILAMSVACRGMDEYERPDTVDFLRENIRHSSFAVGPHRCLGSHLARRELRIALEEWTSRVPQFRIKPGDVPITHGTTVFGVNYLPLVWH